MTSLRLLAVLDVLSSTPARAKRLAPRPDGPLTHFASPRGAKCRLALPLSRYESPDGGETVSHRVDAQDHTFRDRLPRMEIEVGEGKTGP